MSDLLGIKLKHGLRDIICTFDLTLYVMIIGRKDIISLYNLFQEYESCGLFFNLEKNEFKGTI